MTAPLLLERVTFEHGDNALLHLALSGKPLLVSALIKPCEMYRYHVPRVTVTEGHHRQPVFLQNRVYGKIENGDLLWLCSNCHDGVHAWLYHLLGERKKPLIEPGRRIKQEAERTFAWYTETRDS